MNFIYTSSIIMSVIQTPNITLGDTHIDWTSIISVGVAMITIMGGLYAMFGPWRIKDETLRKSPFLNELKQTTTKNIKENSHDITISKQKIEECEKKITQLNNELKGLITSCESLEKQDKEKEKIINEIRISQQKLIEDVDTLLKDIFNII